LSIGHLIRTTVWSGVESQILCQIKKEASSVPSTTQELLTGRPPIRCISTYYLKIFLLVAYMTTRPFSILLL
jgi:hypothetical protein